MSRNISLNFSFTGAIKKETALFIFNKKQIVSGSSGGSRTGRYHSIGGSGKALFSSSRPSSSKHAPTPESTPSTRIILTRDSHILLRPQREPSEERCPKDVFSSFLWTTEGGGKAFPLLYVCLQFLAESKIDHRLQCFVPQHPTKKLQKLSANFSGFCSNSP